MNETTKAEAMATDGRAFGIEEENTRRALAAIGQARPLRQRNRRKAKRDPRRKKK